MLRIQHPTHSIDKNFNMPNRPEAMFPGFKDNTSENASPQILEVDGEMQGHAPNDNIHLPQIRNETPNKQNRRASRFFKFSSERNSFTENLISFFTGSKERGLDRSNLGTLNSNKQTVTSKKETIARNEHRRNTTSSKEKGTRASNNQNNNTTGHPSLRRTDRTRITAATKNETFRPVTSASQKRAQNGHAAHVEDISDVGGYENMYKMKQPASKFSVPRKRSLEISEYLRRENYKYNERTAKQFLFQKWLKSTEMELPEYYPVENNESIVSK